MVSEIIRKHADPEARILDIGTGSGCIAITLACEIKGAKVFALDISKKALRVAQTNAKNLGAEITFMETDILKCQRLPEKYNIIVSNPPYVTEKEKQEMLPNVLEYEPHSALFVKDDAPLIFYAKILELAKECLYPHGCVYFEINEQSMPLPSDDEINIILNRMGKYSEEDELNCGACGYDTCREHATSIYRGEAEIEMCLPYNIDQLHRALDSLAESNETLARVREALVQSEKLASMGQLAAGIAHEINNPLGIVLMYAHLMLDEPDNNQKQRDDLNMIVDQTERCKKIVAGLLNFARQNKLCCKPAHVGELVDQIARTTRPPENIKLLVNNFDFDLKLQRRS